MIKIKSQDEIKKMEVASSIIRDLLFHLEDKYIKPGISTLELDKVAENYIFEKAIGADFAIIRAEIADTFGNMRYNTAGINFAPLMAMAADITLVEAKKVVDAGGIDPEDVHASGISVDYVSQITNFTGEYNAIRR